MRFIPTQSRRLSLSMRSTQSFRTFAHFDFFSIDHLCFSLLLLRTVHRFVSPFICSPAQTFSRRTNFCLHQRILRCSSTSERKFVPPNKVVPTARSELSIYIWFVSRPPMNNQKYSAHDKKYNEIWSDLWRQKCVGFVRFICWTVANRAPVFLVHSENAMTFNSEALKTNCSLLAIMLSWEDSLARTASTRCSTRAPYRNVSSVIRSNPIRFDFDCMHKLCF